MLLLCGQGFNPAEVPSAYGDTLTFWDWRERRVVQTIKLGAEGLIPLELRFLHDPDQAHGYVGAALSSNVIHFTKVCLAAACPCACPLVHLWSVNVHATLVFTRLHVSGSGRLSKVLGMLWHDSASRPFALSWFALPRMSTQSC